LRLPGFLADAVMATGVPTTIEAPAPGGGLKPADSSTQRPRKARTGRADGGAGAGHGGAAGRPRRSVPPQVVVVVSVWIIPGLVEAG
jgi:hypothetical protein